MTLLEQIRAIAETCPRAAHVMFLQERLPPEAEAHLEEELKKGLSSDVTYACRPSQADSAS